MSDLSAATIGEAGRQFHAGPFEGPLDLLLFLIKKSEVNIYDIPISVITEQYLDHLRYSRADLDHITEFHVMAATLLYIKSRMLLPIEVDFDEEPEDPRKDLVDRLIEYQRIKKLSGLMAEREHDAEWSLERAKNQRMLPFQEEEIWRKIEVWDLLRTFHSIMSGLSAEHVFNLFEEVSINEKLSLINELIEDRGEFDFTDLITKAGSVMDVICAFLAVLEAVKSRRIGVFQDKFFGGIRIRVVPTKQEDETGPRNGAD